jgi:hypothetical protein
MHQVTPDHVGSRYFETCSSLYVEHDQSVSSFVKAVQTLPIILDTSKTIRLIFCALYKLSEPERRAAAEALRQRRQSRNIFIGVAVFVKFLPLVLCERGYGSGKPAVVSTSKKLKTINDMLPTNQPPLTNDSTLTPSKTVSNQKSTRKSQSSK